MSLLNLEMIEDGQDASANAINRRLGSIVGLLNGNLDADNIKKGSLTAELFSSEVFERFYPVGSVYTNASDATNPGTLLGFGVWESFGKGQVLVGVDESQAEFNAVGKTGGEKAHALTAAENGPHSHGVNDGGHSHGMDANGNHNHSIGPLGTSGGAYGIRDGSNASSSGTGFTSSNGNHTHNIHGSGANISIQSNGSGTPHNNLQPFVTVYVWRRTS